jgi:NodT family efflux transporter outer membrane factor (OMF) lipoprotein
MWRGAACALLLVVTGCLPGLYSANPGAPLPDTFNGATTDGSSAQTGIVEFFDDPVLTRLIIQGLVQNQELQIRNQEIQIASNEVMAARGAYLPFLSLDARGGFDRTSRFTPLGAAEEQLFAPGGARFPDPLGNFRLSADFFWQIDIWRQLRNARDAAAQRYVEAIEDRNYLITQLVAETAENYYELMSLDKRLVFLDQTIQLQLQSLDVAKAQKAAARGTELGVQRFLAEVRKNESQRLIVRQKIIETENRINFLVGRFPQGVERRQWDLITLDSRMLYVGVPPQLLFNRRDIRAAEREVAASGLDVQVARANFFPKLILTAGVGTEAFSPEYLFDPAALIANAAGDLAAPLINRQAIRAEYLTANARQLQAIYNYQRTVLDAFTQVVNRINKVDNYRRSVQIKLEQVRALEESVNVARNLFNAPIVEEFARVEYVDVLLATRDLLEARTVLIETKQQQLSAIVNAYQALGGGFLVSNNGTEFPELFCTPANIVLDEMVPLPPTGGDEEPPAPENIPVPLPDPNAPPPGPQPALEPAQ